MLPHYCCYSDVHNWNGACSDRLTCLLRPNVQELLDLQQKQSKVRAGQWNSCVTEGDQSLLRASTDGLADTYMQHEGRMLRLMQKYENTCKHVNMQQRSGWKWSLRIELTMIPAQCGVSLARSEGLMANMRKATAVTATPNSSWNRATSRGKRQILHLWPSSDSGLSSLFLFLLGVSEETFCPFSISATFWTLSLLCAVDSHCWSVWSGQARLQSASLPFTSTPAKASSNHKAWSAAIWKQRKLWTNMENIWTGFLKQLQCHI